MTPAGTYDLTIAPASGDGDDSGDLNFELGTLTIEAMPGDGPANTIIDGGDHDRVISVGGSPVPAAPALTLEGLTIQHGSAAPKGGGILVNSGASLTLIDVQITGNQSSVGAGIAALFGSTLTLTDVLVNKNVAAANGGGFDLENPAHVTIENSTVAENSAGNVGVLGMGGGLFDSGQLGAVNLINCTIADNTGGGGVVIPTGSLPTHLENCLVAGNSGGDVLGPVFSNGHNLVEDASAASGLAATDIAGMNPQLGPLADNGGDLPTIALLAASPALDAGNSSDVPAGLTSDQRGPGFARISGNNVDIGAFEVQQSAATNHLAFGVQPSNSAGDTALAPPVTVEVLDQSGNPVTTDNSDQVTLVVASGPGGFTPNSTTTATVSAGVATFNNLVFNTPGTYTLSESGTGTQGPASGGVFLVGGSGQLGPSGHDLGQPRRPVGQPPRPKNPPQRACPAPAVA